MVSSEKKNPFIVKKRPKEIINKALEFSTNSTPPTVTSVAEILGLENFTANPNTFYSIKVTDNRAIVDSWQLD